MRLAVVCFGLLAATTLAQTPPAPPVKRLLPAGLELSPAERAELAAGATALAKDIDTLAAEREAGPPPLVPPAAIVLIPYGRFCNAAKFAGEIDVFEAMAAVREHNVIDPDRLTVAGFSMGGASTWHLATHHAGRWCAASPGAGFAETPIYTQAFAAGQEPPTWWEQKLWGWYDATLYAGNLFNCPTVAYSGETDPQKLAADLMETAMAAEGVKLERLIGPQTGHQYHPDTKQELLRRLDVLADQGRDPLPDEVRVSTYTLRYPGQSWVRFAGLAKHWERADIVARRDAADSAVLTTKNVTALEVLLPGLRSVTIDGQQLALAASSATHQPPSSHFLRQTNAAWSALAAPESTLRKRPNLTGPIDDAFMDAFVFVRPTGRPLNDRLGAWAAGELAHAEKIWRDIFRGEAPVKDDTAVTPEDIANQNLILWGDPASNRVLAKLLAGGKLPLAWDTQTLVFRGQSYDAAHHAPILIFPNPLNPSRYVVLNSGIDFREHAYGTNALQIPKLPDYAIIDLRTPPGPRWPGKIVEAGFFDEDWKW